MSATLLVLGGSAAGRAVLVGDRLTIGSDPSCALCLTDARVAPVHATIERDGARYLLRSTVGVWIDGQPTLEADLASIVQIDVGEASLMFKVNGGAYVPHSKLGAAPAHPPAPAPASRTILHLGQLAQSRTCGAAAQLDHHRVLVAGGRAYQDGPVLATAELYSVSACEGTEIALRTTRETPIVEACATGILIAGGGSASAELFDARTGASRWVASMHALRTIAGSHALPDGRVLVLGGQRGTTIGEVYDPERDRWASLAGPPVGYADIADLGGGRLFVRALAGGAVPRPPPTYFVLDTATWRFTAVPPPRVPRDNTQIVATGDGRALVMGGYAQGWQRTVERFDPATRRLEPVAEMLAPRSGFGAAPLGGGRVLIAGGDSLDMGVYSGEIYDLAADRWDGVAIPEGLRPLEMITRGDGGVVLVGSMSVLLAA